MKKNTILDKVDLPTEVKEGIASRSSMLGATLKTVPEEDLIQEGLLLVYSVMKRKPDASVSYIMKAINNRYATIQKKEILRKKLNFKSLESDNAEKDLDNMSYRIFQKKLKSGEVEKKASDVLLNNNNAQLEAIYTLKESGMTWKEIASYMGQDSKTIRRLLRKYGKKETSKDV